MQAPITPPPQITTRMARFPSRAFVLPASIERTAAGVVLMPDALARSGGRIDQDLHPPVGGPTGLAAVARPRLGLAAALGPYARRIHAIDLERVAHRIGARQGKLAVVAVGPGRVAVADHAYLGGVVPGQDVGDALDGRQEGGPDRGRG